jgi:very-short-patch-repair endonuclease
MAWNRESPKPPSASAASNAPRLRKTTTDAEKHLWNALRKELPEISGTHFRRQVAIGSYVADFVCLGSRLIVEVDGPIHDNAAQRNRDAQRDAYLRDQNFRVIRFSNEMIMLDMMSVLRTVRVALATPTPSPSPQGGGESNLVVRT